MTVPATVQIHFDESYIQQELQNKIAEFVRPQLILCTKQNLCEMFSMSPNELEDNFLTHPSVKIHERRKGERGKRRWLYEPTISAIKEILDHEW